MKLLKDLFSVEAWRVRCSRRIGPWLRKSWPNAVARSIERPRKIAVVTVNYNTKDYLARLIFSLKRITDDSVQIGPIVVVDNNSSDGSIEFIQQLDKAGLIVGIINRVQKYHGPGLNQGMEFLRSQAAAGKAGYTDIDYVFVVDSDVFITRGEFFTHCLHAMGQSGADLSGEFFECEYIEGGYAHVSSILFDPKKCWRRGLQPFEEHGVPALEFQRTMIRQGLVRLDYPHRTNLYLIHITSGTLKAICATNDRSNKYFDWASENLAKLVPQDQKTEYVLEEFEDVFRREVTSMEPQKFIESCLVSAKIRLKRPYEVAPVAQVKPGQEILKAGLVAR